MNNNNQITEVNRTLNNSMFLKKWYKSSTIPRLKEIFGYNTLEDIDNCNLISQWLDLCYYNHYNCGYVQEELFQWITKSKDIENDVEEIHKCRLDIIRILMNKDGLDK